MTTSRFVLRSRLLLWMRQISLFVVMCLNIYTFIYDHSLNSSQDNSNTTNSNHEKGMVYYVSHVLFILALVLILLADDIRNLGKPSILKAWLVVYVIIFLHSAVVYLCTQTWQAIVQLCISVVTLSFAILTAFLDLHTLEVNPPSAEYTCGLISSLSFSYLNPILIVPGMKKESFEFDEVR